LGITQHGSTPFLSECLNTLQSRPSGLPYHPAHVLQGWLVWSGACAAQHLLDRAALRDGQFCVSDYDHDVVPEARAWVAWIPDMSGVLLLLITFAPPAWSRGLPSETYPASRWEMFCLMPAQLFLLVVFLVSLCQQHAAGPGCYLRRVLTGDSIQGFGDVSYGVYLVHIALMPLHVSSAKIWALVVYPAAWFALSYLVGYALHYRFQPAVMSVAEPLCSRCSLHVSRYQQGATESEMQPILG